MALRSISRNLVLLAIGAVGCDRTFDPTLGVVDLPILESGGMGLEDDAPWWAYPGRPISTPSSIPFQLLDELALADCSTGEPVCRPDRACLGWVEYSFVIDQEGKPRKVRFEGSCPLTIVEAPFRAVLSEWRFPPWANDRADHLRFAFTSTRMAYPIELEPRSSSARRVTGP